MTGSYTCWSCSLSLLARQAQALCPTRPAKARTPAQEPGEPSTAQMPCPPGPPPSCSFSLELQCGHPLSQPRRVSDKTTPTTGPLHCCLLSQSCDSHPPL